jgi:hypothetical protein
MIYAVNATNKNEMYSFFMPITAMLWKKVIGWDSISILVGTKESWMKEPRSRFIVEQSQKFSKVHFLKGVPGLKSTSVAQICRIYSSAIPGLNPDDYLITADVDMFPLNKKWFDQKNPNKDFCVWNAQVWHNRKRMAICYLGATVKIWREVMGIKSQGLSNAIEKACKGKRVDWRFDENNVTKRITSWSGWKNRVQLIKCCAPYTRIYREDGPFNRKTIGNAIDSHVWRPGFNHHNWTSIKNMLQLVCDEQDFQWLMDYRKQYIGLPPGKCAKPDYNLKQNDIG